MKREVSTPNGSYEVVFERGIINRIGEKAKLDRRVLVVTDSGVPRQYAEAVASQCRYPVIVTLPQGEENKTIENWTLLLKEMLRNGFTRTDCAVGVGGGVVTDITGFAAASFMRGIDFYNVPTTLLAQTDASVGGKTAVDLDGVKNTVGAFYQPKGVYIDFDVLKTLDSRQFSSGMAEIIKIAVCTDAELFSLIEGTDINTDNIDKIVYESVCRKAETVERDEKESDIRRILNFGHTVGHAVETLTGLLHGESVGVGMTYMCSENVLSRLIPVLKRFGLPTSTDIVSERLIEVISHDKKADGDSINIVTCEEIGTARITKIPMSELSEIIKGKRNEL